MSRLGFATVAVMVAGAAIDGATAQEPVPQQPTTQLALQYEAPQEPAPRGDAAKAREDVPAQRERTREALQRTLEALEREAEQVRASVRRLEEGAAAGAALREMDASLRRRVLAEGVRGGGEGRELPSAEALGTGGRRGPLATPEERERMMREFREHLPEVAAGLEELRRTSPRLADGTMQRMAPRIREALAVRRDDPHLFALRSDELRAGLGVLRAISEFRRASEQATSPNGNPNGNPTGKPADANAERAQADGLEKARDGVRAAVGAALEARLQLQEHETKRLERRLEELRGQVRQRREGKSDAVDAMVERIQRGEMPSGLMGEERGPKVPRAERLERDGFRRAGPRRERPEDDRVPEPR